MPSVITNLGAGWCNSPCPVLRGQAGQLALLLTEHKKSKSNYRHKCKSRWLTETCKYKIKRWNARITRAPPKSACGNRAINWSCETWGTTGKKPNEKRFQHSCSRICVYFGIELETIFTSFARKNADDYTVKTLKMKFLTKAQWLPEEILRLRLRTRLWRFRARA